MAIRSNHYDLAFEEYLRKDRVPYVVVDEKRRSLLKHESLKSMDFIVYSAARENLLVDVKGRRFPSGNSRSGRKWENWATQDDLRSLKTWETIFGHGFRAILVFAYEVVDPRFVSLFEEAFEFRQRIYSFFGVGLGDYAQRMKVRSASWETVSISSRAFRELRQPIRRFLDVT